MRRKLRICVVWPHPRLDRIREYLKDPGNRYEMMDGLSPLVSRMGHTLDVLDSTPYPWNPLAKRGSLWAGLDPLRFMRQLFRIRRYDAVICYGDSSAYFLSWFRSTTGLRLPIVLIDPALECHYQWRQSLQKQILPRMDRVVVFGSNQVTFLAEKFGGKVRSQLILHRVDTCFFDPAKGERETERTEPYALSVGRDAFRDMDTLIQAFRGYPLKLRLVCKGIDRGDLPSNIEVCDKWVSFETLRSWYAKSAFVIMATKPTIHAGGVNGILEAMSMGKALIASASPALRDYLIPEENALVIPMEQVGSLRAAMDRLRRDPGFGAQLGRKARNFCLERVSIERYAGQIDAILQEVTA